MKWIGRWFTERRLIVLVVVILAIEYVLVGLATEIWTLFFAAACISIGVALARPTFIAPLSVRVPARRQGVVMGAIQSLIAGTDVVTPILAGLILGPSLYGIWIGAVVTIAVLGAVIAGIWLRPGGAEPATRSPGPTSR